jgi:hypothetical protein
VNFELVESAIPTAGEVEDRHVEHKHGIVLSPAAREHFSPSVGEILSLNLHFRFSSPEGSSIIHFLSGVHSFVPCWLAEAACDPQRFTCDSSVP